MTIAELTQAKLDAIRATQRTRRKPAREKE